MFVRGGKIDGDLKVSSFDEEWYDKVIEKIQKLIGVFWDFNNVNLMRVKSFPNNGGTIEILKFSPEGDYEWKVSLWYPDEWRGGMKVKFSVKGPIRKDK